MHVLQRTFGVVLVYLSILPRVLSILLKIPTNTSGYDNGRHPTFKENVLGGLVRAQAIARSSTPLPMLEVRNTVGPGSQGSSNLNKFLSISIDVLVTQDPLPPYMGRRATVYGSARRWGSWGMNLVGFQDVDAVTASRAFALSRIIMDEEDAHAILHMNGIFGPWDCIYLCKLPTSGSLFYIFQRPQQEDSPQTSYQTVEVESGRVRLYRSAVQQPCSQLALDLTTNATFQAGPMNRTDLPAPPSRPTNATSQIDFEVDGALRENITAS